MISLTQLLYEISELGKVTGFDYIEDWLKYKETINHETLDSKR